MTVSSVRLSRRSASTPPRPPNSSIGRNCSPAVMPTAAPLPGELHDQPHLGHDLHPVAGDRDHLAGEVAPVVGDAQRRERAPDGRAHASVSASIRSSSAAARASVARSSAPSASSRAERNASLRVRDSVEQRAAGVRRAHERGAAVGRVGRAAHEPGLLEPGQDARDRRAAGSARARRARSASAARRGRCWPAPSAARATGRSAPPGAGAGRYARSRRAGGGRARHRSAK